MRSVHKYSTKFYDMDPKSESSISFLSKAKIACPQQEILSSFVYEQNDKKQFRYNYECVGIRTKLMTEEIINDWSEWGHWNYASPESRRLGNVNFLDRQTIECGGRRFLTSLQTENQFETISMRYIYQCAKPEGRMRKPDCEDRTTDNDDSRDFFLPALQDHNVKCNENEGLSKFFLRVDYKPPRGHVWYNYTCCKLF